MSKTAFIFPGQGAQKAGMGRDFYDAYKTAREVFQQAEEWLSLDVKALCFEPNSRLDQTEYTQAALVTTCLAMSHVVEEHGLHPDMCAGLSLGEYCAIETAGGMQLKDTITTVRQRGILMENAVPKGRGGMAAVLGMAADRIVRVLEDMDGVFVANYNCPGQIVITGGTQELEQAVCRLKEVGARRVVPLNVSGPFHSPMLERAGRELGQVLENTETTMLKIPYFTNVTAKAVTDADKIKDLLVRQISSSVRWQQSMENMIEAGVDTFVEIGPGRTLAGFLKKISGDVKVYNIQTTQDMQAVLDELADRRAV